MSILQKREVEIPLNGGMNTSAGAEYQSVETMRNVLDLRLNADGEYEKRPMYASVFGATDPSNGAYTDLTIDGIVESRGEVYGLTRGFGVLNEDGKYVGGGGSDISLGAIPFVTTLAPMAARVGRLTVDRASASNIEQGFQSAASCVYNSTTLILVSCSYSSSGNGCILRLQALDIKTGAVIAQVMYDNDIVGSTRWAVDCCENTDASAPGAVITWAMGSAPYSIRKYRYLANSKTFVYDTLLVNAGAAAVQHRIKTSPTAAGRFILAYTNQMGPALNAHDIACTAGTVGTAISSHTGTHPASGGIDIAIDGTNILIASISAAAVGNTVYAERYGTPAAAIAVATAAGTNYYHAVAVGRETSQTITSRAVLWATLTDLSSAVSAGYHVVTETGLLDFSATTVSEALALSTHVQPNAHLIGFGCSHGNRAFCLMGMASSYLTEEPSAMFVRGGESYASSLMIDQPIARVAHDILSYPVQTPVFTNLLSTFVVGNTLYSVVTTDPSEDTMDSDGRRLPQTLSLVRCEFGKPVTYAQKDGVASIAAGVLFDIDGANAMVSQHQCKPTVRLDVSGGTGQTGTFLVTAIYRWVDAAGREHRSAPAIPVSTGAIVNKAINAYVTRPPWEVFQDTIGVRTYSIDVYITADGGSTYYLANTAGGRKRTSFSTGGGYRLYTTLLPGVAGNPQPYSMGDGDDALVSEPPPAFLATVTIGDRMWAIDAEDRTRIWPSKPFEDGYAVEWNTANTLTIGDEGVGITDLNGVPTILGEHGIWQIYGEGPNALGVGSFAPARRLPQEVECLDPLSVCKTNVGTFFRARKGVMLLGNDGSLQEASAPISGELTVTGDPTGYCRIAYDELMGEVHVRDFNDAHWVLNLNENKWQKWSQFSLSDWNDFLSLKGRMWFCSTDAVSGDGVNRQLAIDETDYQRTFEGWTLETPWIRFDGVTGNMRIYDVIVQLRLGEPESARGDVRITYQTREGSTDQFDWTAADLTSMGDAGDVVNLRCRISAMRTKQFKLEIVETPGAVGEYEGNVPVGMRVIYGITPGGDRQRSTAQTKGPTPVS